MRVHVLFFASYQDIAGASDMELDLPVDAAVADCAALLQRMFPRFADALPTGRIAVNQNFSNMSRALENGDEVAFMPPMSGG